MRHFVNPCIYVIVNSSLNMSPGKAMSQVAHAVSTMMSEHAPFGAEPTMAEVLDGSWQARPDEEKLFYWHKIDPRTVIVLDGKSDNTMKRFSEYLKKENIKVKHSCYVDESSGYELTAMALEPLEKTDPRTPLIVGYFDLYILESKEREKLTAVRRCAEQHPLIYHKILEILDDV